MTDAARVVVAGRTRTGLRLRCTVCGEEFDATCQDCVQGFVDAHQHTHYGLGDLVAAGIKRLFGIAPCRGCHQRQATLNQVAPRVWPR